MLRYPIFLCVFLQLAAHTWGADYPFKIGTAKINITPDYPIRLSGYAARTNESDQVSQPIFARALAISRGWSAPAVLVTVDNCGLTREIRDEVVQRLYRRSRLFSERVTICSTHTHNAPILEGALDNLFLGKETPEEEIRIRRYTRELIDKLEQVAVEALEARQPARLFFAQGTVGFAANRRTTGGPVDHDAPVLVARGGEDQVLAVVANYACHCTTLGSLNEIHGDWAGMAGHILEQYNPEAVALVTIGCGADSNPNPRGRVSLAERFGAELAREAQWLIDTSLQEITGKLSISAEEIELPFAKVRTEAEWMERAQQPGVVGYHARRNLERLRAGVEIPETLPYFIQTWTFGHELAMVFLPGEVVVDYSLALKKKFDADRLWVTAYANYVPCYIPSQRILKEGGYEAEGSLWWYDRPARLAPETEELIISAVDRLLPREFLAGAELEEGESGGRLQIWDSLLEYLEPKPLTRND